MSTEYLTEPGTEDNLRLIVDANPFDTEPQEPSAPYPLSLIHI